MTAARVETRRRAYDGLTCRWEEIDGRWQITAVFDAAAYTPPMRRRPEAMTTYPAEEAA